MISVYDEVLQRAGRWDWWARPFGWLASLAQVRVAVEDAVPLGERLVAEPGLDGWLEEVLGDG